MRGLLIVAVLGLAACEGAIVAPGPGPDPLDPTTPAGPTKPATPNDGWPKFGPAQTVQLRRLTKEQYVASVKTLLAITPSGLPPIEPVSPVAGFSSIGASAAVVSAAGVGQFEDAAIFLAKAAFSPTTRAALTPCTPGGIGDTACFRSFVTTFGQRAFRRPLTPDEADRYAALAAEVATRSNDAWAGLESTVTAFLQSPHFLYLVEVGEPDPTRPGHFRFTSYEMASRLSYFLTNNTPDDALLAAAAAGQLTTPQGIRSQTDRLLKLPQAREAVRVFFSGLLALDGLDTLARPVQAYPGFTATLPAALKEETLLTFEDLVFTRDADVREAFDSPTTFVNAELAKFYGLAAPTAPGFSKVTAAAQRRGVLGQAGVLAVHDHTEGTSPTKRGLFVLTRLLCQDLALAPPSNLPIPPPPQGVLTARQRLEQHVGNPTCASCHVAMDSVGLSLEKFDALGAWREQDRGLPIDAKGTLDGATYDGVTGLAPLVRQHKALSPCLLQSLYGSSVGHMPTDFDKDTFAAIVKAFDANGARLQPLLTAIAASDGFRFAN